MLYPTILIVTAVMTVIGGVNFSNVGQMVLDITAIQLGYVLGAAARPRRGEAQLTHSWADRAESR